MSRRLFSTRIIEDSNYNSIKQEMFQVELNSLEENKTTEMCNENMPIEQVLIKVENTEDYLEENQTDTLCADTVENEHIKIEHVSLKQEITEELIIRDELPIENSLKQNKYFNYNEFKCQSNTANNDEKANNAINPVLPTKSTSVYEAAYKRFIKWCVMKNVENYSENVLLAYFSEFANELKMKSSSMWSQYSMLKSLLNIKHNIDISKYIELKAYLKKQNEGYVPKKAKTLSKQEFDKFIYEAPDEKYLGTKIILIFGTSGACRCDELVKMKTDDIKDLGTALLIKIADGKNAKTRSFTIVGENYLNLYRKYCSLRPKNMIEKRFFLKYQNGVCHRIVMGIHKIGSAAKEVAYFLKLPNWKEYTGHSLRSTSATLLVESKADITCLKRPGGYIEESREKNELTRRSVEDTNNSFSTNSNSRINIDNSNAITETVANTSAGSNSNSHLIGFNFQDSESLGNTNIQKKVDPQNKETKDTLKGNSNECLMEDRSFKCEICEKTFTKFANLMRHKKNHSGEKPFTCDICQKEFNNKYNLKKHIRIHNGEKPFECDVCLKTFTEPHHLNMHKRVHSGEKPYECDSCEKKFSHSHHLKRHKRGCGEERIYSCDVCKEKFDFSYQLKSHKLVHKV